MNHLHEDDLVLHYYGELDRAASLRTDAHLAECGDCRASYVRLQQVMAAVNAMPEPVLPEGFERTVWARLEPALPARKSWLSWFVLSPARLAWASAVIVLVAAAFFAGRLTQDQTQAPATEVTEALRERVLLAALGEHLDRSQMMLVDIVSASGGDVIDFTTGREQAEQLVASNRLYRQTAAAAGETRLAELLDELERLLVELAASPDKISAEEMNRVRERIDDNGLLFKVRVLSSTVRERQKQQLRARTGQSS